MVVETQQIEGSESKEIKIRATKMIIIWKNENTLHTPKSRF
jgi:hypothetical protein